MRKIAILTRRSLANYGTLLQSYALQKMLRSMGEDAVTVDEGKIREEYAEKERPQKEKATLKVRLYGWYDKKADRRRLRRYRPLTRKMFVRFERGHIRYDRAGSAADVDRDYDTVISGSDQIWAEAAEPEMYPFFMQDFVKDDKVKASYAVSVGSDYSPENRAKVKRYLSSFDFLSVREASSAAVLKQYTDKEIRIVCDPVLLLPKSDWDALAGERRVKEKYIFCFFLTDHEWYFSKVKELLKVYPDREVLFFSRKTVSGTGYRQIPDTSPEEFLNYIKYADHVLTDSYHAFLFALIFQKNINVLERFSNIENNFQNERLKYLMERVGIGERFLTERDPVRTESIDHAGIDRILHSFSEDSSAYLRQVLSYRKG